MIKLLKPYFLISLLILSVAAGIRLTNLNSLPVFADESIYMRWSQVMRAESTLRFLPLSDGKQPLYMWATIPLFKIISDPLIAGRILSVLTGLGTIAGIAAASLLLFRNSRQALIAATIAAVLPYLVFFDRMALADSMLTMFVIWTFVLYGLAVTTLRLDLAMMAGFTLGFAWLTKSPAIFSLLLLPSLWLLTLKQQNFKKTLIKLIALTIVTYLIAAGMYNILRLGPEFHMISLRNQDYIYPLSEVLKHPHDPLTPHLRDVIQFFFYLTTPLGLVLIAWGAFSEKFSHLKQRVILVGWLIIPILAQAFIAKTFTARYLLFTVPFAVLLMAHAIEHIGQHTKKHILSLLAAAAIILPALWTDFHVLTQPESAPLPRIERSGYLEEWTAGHGLKDVSQRLKSFAASGPVVVGSEGFFGTPFDGLQMYLNDTPNVRVVGVGVWIDSIHEKLLSARSDNQVFLVVNSTRFHGDADKLGLKLIESYPKAARPDGTREYLLFFQVPSN